jgi:acyl dehydratase
LRASIEAKACHCTTEVFLWPSIVFQPKPLMVAMIKSRAWRQVQPLDAGDTVTVENNIDKKAERTALGALAAGETVTLRPTQNDGARASVSD